MRPLLPALLLLAPLQDPPKITIDRAAPLSELIPVFEKAGGRIDAGEVEDKELKISVKDASYFEALDAVCRAHGMATYLDLRGGMGTESFDLQLKPAPWVDYPSAYHGPFKIAAVAMARFRTRQESGEHDWVRVHLLLCSPPSIPADHGSCAEAEWSVTGAQDAAGRDVLAALKEEPTRLLNDIAQSPYVEGNVDATSVTLRPFDLDKGLQVLKGVVKLRTATPVDVPIPLEAGTTVDAPGGTIAVDAVREHDKKDRGSVWRIQLTYKPKEKGATLPRAFEKRVRHGGAGDDTGWHYQSLPEEGLTFDVQTWQVAKRPEWLRLRARAKERTVEIPFEIRNVVFKKE